MGLIARLTLRCELQNFDEVLVPADHVSRNPNDTYYIDTDTVLRCHTSAHQVELLRQQQAAFLVTGACPLTQHSFLLPCFIVTASRNGVLLLHGPA